MPATSSFEIDVHDSISALDREEWNRVVRESDATVFYDFDILAAYEAAPLEPDSAHAYLTVRQKGSGKLVGVLPAYVQDPMNAFFHLPEGDPTAELGGTRGLVTHFWHCYDSSLPLSPEVEGEDRRQALVEVCGVLAGVARDHGACGYGFLDMAASRPEAAWLAELGFNVRPLTERFVLDLTGVSTLEDHLKSLSMNQRRELRRQPQWAAAEGVTVETRLPPLTEIEEIVAICRRTAARYKGEDYYPEEPFRTFLRQAGDTVRAVMIHAQGTLVGTGVCFLHNDRFHAWAGGMRYDLCRASPYVLVFREILRYAIEIGVRRVEGGRANARFKQRLGFSPVPLVTALRRV